MHACTAHAYGTACNGNNKDSPIQITESIHEQQLHKPGHYSPQFHHTLPPTFATMSTPTDGLGTGTTVSGSTVHGGTVIVQWGEKSEMSFAVGKSFKHEEKTLIHDAAVRLGLAGRDDDEDEETWGKKSVYVLIGEEYRLKKIHRIFADVEAILNGEDRDVLENGRIRVVNDMPGVVAAPRKRTRKQGTQAQSVRFAVLVLC